MTQQRGGHDRRYSPASPFALLSGFELLGVGSGTEPFSLPLSAPELFPLELARSLPLALPTEGEGPCKRKIERMRLTKCDYHSLTAIPN